MGFIFFSGLSNSVCVIANCILAGVGLEILVILLVICDCFYET